MPCQGRERRPSHKFLVGGRGRFHAWKEVGDPKCELKHELKHELKLALKHKLKYELKLALKHKLKYSMN